MGLRVWGAGAHPRHRGRQHRDVDWFRGGLVFKAHRLLYHSTLGSRVIKRKKRLYGVEALTPAAAGDSAEMLSLSLSPFITL